MPVFTVVGIRGERLGTVDAFFHLKVIFQPNSQTFQGTAGSKQNASMRTNTVLMFSNRRVPLQPLTKLHRTYVQHILASKSMNSSFLGL